MTAINSRNYQTTRAQAFFWWCAGVNRRLLEQCPNDHLKYTALGVMTCLAGCVASISGGSFAALTLNTGRPATIAIGLAWGFLIFNLDRLLLVAARKLAGESKRAAPRFLLALSLALLIGEPLMLRMFQGEIEAELKDRARVHTATTVTQAQAELQPQLDAASNELKSLQGQLAQLKERRDKAESDYIAEKEGSGGTRRPGEGPVFRERLDAYNRAKTEYETERPKLEAKIATQESVIAGLQKQIEDAKAGDDATQEAAKGGLARHKALFAIVRRDAGAALLYVPLFLVLLGLEVVPLTAKTFAPMSRYDKLLLEEDAKGIAEVEWDAARDQHLREQNGASYDSFAGDIIRVVANGQRNTLTDAEEKRLADELHNDYVTRFRRTVFAGRPVAADLPPIAVEVTSHPTFQGSLILPGNQADATLDDLEGDLAQLAEAIAKSEGQAVGLTAATSARGADIWTEKPLWPQLAPNGKLKLEFAPLSNGGGLPLS